MRFSAFTLVCSLQSIHAGRLFTQGAHVEGATVGFLPKPALNANGVQATGDAVADAVDSAMACQRKAGSVAEPSARRNDRPAARRDARRAAFFAARKTVSTVTRARQTARASLKLSMMARARMRKINIPRDARVELVRPHLFTRARFETL